MSFLDKIKDRLTPEQSNAPIPIATSASGGIGSRRGAMGFEDDVRILSHLGVFFALLRVGRVKRVVALSNLRYVTMFVALPSSP